jgi:hypothetical protein
MDKNNKTPLSPLGEEVANILAILSNDTTCICSKKKDIEFDNPNMIQVIWDGGDANHDKLERLAALCESSFVRLDISPYGKKMLRLTFSWPVQRDHLGHIESIVLNLIDSTPLSYKIETENIESWLGCCSRNTLYIVAPDLDDYRYSVLTVVQGFKNYPLVLHNNTIANHIMVIGTEKDFLSALRGIFYSPRVIEVVKDLFVGSVRSVRNVRC